MEHEIKDAINSKSDNDEDFKYRKIREYSRIKIINDDGQGNTTIKKYTERTVTTYY